MTNLEIRTHDREELLDITPAVRRAIRENGWSDGPRTRTLWAKWLGC
jgi:thiamine phosphate synthase YjbQ (UPF0047 family)